MQITSSGLLKTVHELRDEVALKAHLLEMEWLEKWHSLQTKVDDIERKLLKNAQRLGEWERHEVLGDEQELQRLVEDLKALKARLSNKSANKLVDG